MHWLLDKIPLCSAYTKQIDPETHAMQQEIDACLYQQGHEYIILTHDLVPLQWQYKVRTAVSELL